MKSMDQTGVIRSQALTWPEKIPPMSATDTSTPSNGIMNSARTRVASLRSSDGQSSGNDEKSTGCPYAQGSATVFAKDAGIDTRYTPPFLIVNPPLVDIGCHDEFVK